MSYFCVYDMLLKGTPNTFVRQARWGFLDEKASKVLGQCRYNVKFQIFLGKIF